MVRMLTHDEIEIGGGTQARSEINYFVVNEYAEHYRNGIEFPPLVVYDDGAKKWLSRGFHRYHASKDAGVEKVPCEIRKGSKRDAVWDAIADNQSHGLRRTNADKRRAVEMALKDKEWSAMSNVAIAEHVGVDPTFVLRVRNEAEQVVPDTTEKRTGRDGKKQAAKKKKKPKPAQVDEPQACDGEAESTPDDDADLVARCTIKANALKWFDKVEEAIDELDGGLTAARRTIRDFLES